MGSSTVFFTLLSQRQRSGRFVAIFGYWVGLQFLVSLALVYWLLPDSMIERIWMGELHTMLVFALIATFIQTIVWRSVFDRVRLVLTLYSSTAGMFKLPIVSP